MTSNKEDTEDSSLLDPTSNHEPFRVQDSEINDREGNYIFTVGNVSSGKSCLQNLLIARLWDKEDISFDPDRNPTDPRRAAELLHWIKRMLQGFLPPRTQAGLLQDFTITFGQEGRPSLDVNFLEISGESVKSILPNRLDKTKPSLDRQLERFLQNPKINKRFVFVSDCTANRKTSNRDIDIHEDALFNRLLVYLIRDLEIPRINVLFVAAKWDEVNAEYRSVEEYFRTNFRQTRVTIRKGTDVATYISFSIGAIEDAEVLDDESGAMVQMQKVTRYESKYVDVLIQWIYWTYTNRYLRNMPRISYTWYERLLRMVRF